MPIGSKGSVLATKGSGNTSQRRCLSHERQWQHASQRQCLWYHLAVVLGELVEVVAEQLADDEEVLAVRAKQQDKQKHEPLAELQQ